MAAVYHHNPAAAGEFCCEINEAGQLVSLSHRDDPHHMNWVEGKQLWGTVTCPEGLEVQVERSFTDWGTLETAEIRFVLDASCSILFSVK